jgi:hypothetical protein
MEHQRLEIALGVSSRQLANCVRGKAACSVVMAAVPNGPCKGKAVASRNPAWSRGAETVVAIQRVTFQKPLGPCNSTLNNVHQIRLTGNFLTIAIET